MRLAADAIDRGDLGRLAFATWRFGGEAGTSRHPHANLIETQCHGFDLLEHLCGPIDSVMAQMADPAGNGWSTLAVALHFASGAVGQPARHATTRRTPTRTPTCVELNGTAGPGADRRHRAPVQLQRAGDEIGAGLAGRLLQRHRPRLPRHLRPPRRRRCFPRCAAGGPPPVPVTAGRRALVLAHAVIRSFETGARVATPPTG